MFEIGPANTKGASEIMRLKLRMSALGHGNALIEQKISGSASKADMPMAAVASVQVDGES